MNERRTPSFFEYLRKSRLPWIIMGVVCAFISIVPYIILGKDSVITYHDQLDGELLTYILNAKHFTDGFSNYPEVMNGISKNGMVSPAPLFVLFFCWFKRYTAFIVCMAVIRLFSVISMFLLLDELTHRKLISLGGALVFMLLPFYTVYGLCIPGQPILYYSYLRFKKDKWEWPLYVAIAFYAGASSLALCGYAVLCVLGVLLVVSIIKKEYPLRNAISLGVMILIYFFENLSLVKQVLGISEGFVSHKSEVVKAPVAFFRGVWKYLWTGADYTEAYQKYFFPVILLSLIFGGIYILITAGDKDVIEKIYRNLLFSVGSLLLIACLSAFTDAPLFIAFQNSRTGFFREFNFSRFSWLMTSGWIVSFALSLSVLWEMADNLGAPGLAKIVWTFIFAGSMAITVFFSVLNSDLKSNLVKLWRHGDYYMMTWNQFYAEDLFYEAKKLIGKECSDYRVVSLGIYPAAAQYNGMYCLDAYSNNYDVNYKHQFREVIASELEKSDYLREWFDGWGNRCYIVLNESMNYFAFEKRWGTYSTEYDLNFEKLKEMGCGYLISASYLVDSEEHGLTLLNENEEAIESADSWYRLFVYKINDDVGGES